MRHLPSVLLLVGIFILSSCSKGKNEEGSVYSVSVTTSEVSSITPTAAICGGKVTSDGSTVTAKGVVWSTDPNPTISLPTRTFDGSGIGIFTSVVTNLSPNTTYYVRAYAVNSIGTYYGNQQTFTTSAEDPLLVTTNEVSSITESSAVCGGQVKSGSRNVIIAMGVVWSTEPSPTVKLSTKTNQGGGTGTMQFSSTITNLSQNTEYYVRAYATTTDSTTYGDEKKFTTSSEPSEPPAQADCFYFTAVEPGAEISMLRTDGAPEVSLIYSTNGDNWHNFEVGVTKVVLPNISDTVYFRAKGENTAFCLNYDYNCFFSTKPIKVGGNIMYLLNGRNAQSFFPKSSINAFRRLFRNCPITDAGFLVLPATQLADGCYQEMFKGCVSLEIVPVLHAKQLAYRCYAGMFSGCISLTTAPELPATQLAEYCYSHMFEGCTSLEIAPKLPAMNLANACYFDMFSGCTSLTTAPELPATQLATYCYSDMFSGCTSLTTAPELSATQLAHSCYYQMFDGCTSLTTAPELTATQLAKHCYQSMFSGCTSLTTAPELPATQLAEWCYYQMFEECTSLTTAPELPVTPLADYCYHSMFDGCTSLTTAPELPATQLKDYCYACMFLGCTSLTTAPELPATQLAEYCYYQMFEGCTSLTTAPELPVTPLADYCYAYMFERCKKLSHVKMLATDVSANSCLWRWISAAGMEASSRTLTVAPGMSSDSTILANTPHGTATDSWTIVEQQ